MRLTAADVSALVSTCATEAALTIHKEGLRATYRLWVPGIPSQVTRARVRRYLCIVHI